MKRIKEENELTKPEKVSSERFYSLILLNEILDVPSRQVDLRLQKVFRVAI